jgi:hypothetical protein
VSIANLIRKRTPGESATAIPAIPAIFATQPKGEAVTVARIATVAVANPPEAKAVTPDPATEARRQRVLAMLADNPALRLAVVCDGAGDPVPVAVAIRGKGTVEILIPAARFDPFALLALVERHSVH